MTDPDLTLVPSADLVNELFKRFDAAIFSGSKDKTTSETEAYQDQQGTWHACYGLAHGLVDSMRCIALQQQCGDEEEGSDDFVI